MGRGDVGVLSDIELVWAAGLFAGEGCALVQRSRERSYVALSINMYDERSMVRFASAISPYVGERKKNVSTGAWANRGCSSNGNALWYCKLAGQPAEGALRALLVHLKNTDKGDQIERALAEVANNQNPSSRQTVRLSRAKAQQIRSLRSNGNTPKELASSFGVSVTTIYNVLHGKVWK